MAKQAPDPFAGVSERRVMPAEMTLLDMEEMASRMALEQAGIAASEVTLLLTNRTVPDVLLSNPACGLHARLGLPHECLSTHLDVATHSFMMQLSLAEGMIAAGRARYALLVQSCAPSRLIAADDPISPNFGDAATAVLVGRVPAAAGILASVMYTDGRYPTTLVASVPGAPWYTGASRLHIADPRQMGAVFLGTADACSLSIATALTRADRRPSDVDFLFVHQGTTWLREVVQSVSGLDRARSIETHAATGYIFASTIPAAIHHARTTLNPGNLVVLVGGGPGQTYGATVLSWA